MIEITKIYVYVDWPESQKLMDEPWFWDECVLDVNISSAYFVPLWRYLKQKEPIKMQFTKDEETT